MAGTFITDMTHYLDEVGRIADLPAPARNLAYSLGSIAAAATSKPPGSAMTPDAV